MDNPSLSQGVTNFYFYILSFLFFENNFFIIISPADSLPPGLSDRPHVHQMWVNDGEQGDSIAEAKISQNPK